MDLALKGLSVPEGHVILSCCNCMLLQQQHLTFLFVHTLLLRTLY